MARNKPEARKSVQVSTSISPELFAALDDYRWIARIDGMTNMFRVALEEYAVNHELNVAAEPAESGE